MKHPTLVQTKLVKSKSQFYPKMHEKAKRQEIRLQNQPLKMLLYRNRSLKLLFGEIPQQHQQCKVEKNPCKVLSPKNQQPMRSNNTHEEVTSNKEKLNCGERNEYMIISHRSKQESSDLEKKNKAKNPKRLDQREAKNIQQSISGRGQERGGNQGKYNADNYNWRKSLSKQKDQLQPIGSPRSIVPLRMSHQDYYPSKNSSKNDTKQTPGKATRNRRTAKSKSLSSQQYREKSPLSKPKVIRHVFEVKAKRQGDLSPKSMLFTFGI